MTNKNDSVKAVRICVDQQKLDPANPTARPALDEIGTLEDGIVVIKKLIGPIKASSLAAKERSCE